MSGKNRRVIQILPTLSFGDAVGNDAMALKKVISEMGYRSEMYAERIDQRVPKEMAGILSQMKQPSRDDVIIYHKSTGTSISFGLDKYKCHRMMIYHNITPPHFFEDYSYKAAERTAFGLEGMRYLRDKTEYCLADSEFNKQDLIEAGYSCRIDVRPILIPFDDYKKTPDSAVIKKYSDGYVNIVFVGRIAPNKKQEDIIKIFNFYKININSRSRLILVGSYAGMESYFDRLKRYVKELELDDVIFTGHTPFAEILAYYRCADIFLCMSEHEGFCVPLVEAMFFDVPVVAYKSCAIPYTMNGSGAVTDTKDPAEIALLIDRILKDNDLKEKIIRSQKERLKDFSYESIKELFESQLNSFIGSV